jgi:oligosaccharide reducing-end xylanase
MTMTTSLSGPDRSTPDEALRSTAPRRAWCVFGPPCSTLALLAFTACSSANVDAAPGSGLPTPFDTSADEAGAPMVDEAAADAELPTPDPDGAAVGETGSEGAGDLPLSMVPAGTDEDGQANDVGEDAEPVPPGVEGVTGNLFTDLLGIPEADVQAKLSLATNRVFGIGTNESSTPVRNDGYRIYYELPQDPSSAFIWVPDTQDIRSEGMSYGMMIALQMDMQQQFDRLWRFAKTYMQYPGNSGVTSWRYYFRWVGSVNTQDPNNWGVNYGNQTGPAPDGEEYFAAALYLADQRWGSEGAFDYRQDANDLARAMLDNPRAQGRTPVIHPDQNMVVFFPNGNSANFTDPSYHLPAFYDLFALEGPPEHRERWLRIAEVSRDYLVRAAHPQTGLHSDYANFDGSPNAGSPRFAYDSWRVPMNMGVDYAWFTQDERMQRQATKYHEFFSTRLNGNNVQNQIYNVDGSGATDGGSTALTAALAAAAHASTFPDRARFVENLWEVGQQSGLYRYYQETVYLLGLLSTSGRMRYDFSDAP